MCALSAFLLSNSAMVPVLAAKAAAAETGGFTWGVAFLPLWVGDGLAAVLLIGAMVSSCCAMAIDYNVPQRSGVLGNDEGDGGGEEGANGVGSGVNVDDGVRNGGEARPSTGAAQEEAHEGDDGSGSGTVAAAANTEAAGAAAERRAARQVSSQMHRNKTMVSGAPNKLNHVKHVLLYYGIGVPFVFLPPLPQIGLLFGFHINIWRYLAASASGDTGSREYFCCIRASLHCALCIHPPVYVLAALTTMCLAVAGVNPHMGASASQLHR